MFSSLSASELDAVVQRVLAAQADQRKLGQLSDTSASGVTAVRAAMVTPEPFDTGQAGNVVRLKDVLTLEQSPRLGCGIMEMEASCFPWELKYDEVDYIIAGRLEILVDNEKIVGKQGDVLFIPKNTRIQFSAPGFVRFLYVTYPANWAGQ